MSAPTVTVVELNDAELRLAINAVHAFVSNFGHDQADILHASKNLCARLRAAAEATASAV